jgi:hypothetical protein
MTIVSAENFHVIVNRFIMHSDQFMNEKLGLCQANYDPDAAPVVGIRWISRREFIAISRILAAGAVSR